MDAYQAPNAIRAGHNSQQSSVKLLATRHWRKAILGRLDEPQGAPSSRAQSLATRGRGWDFGVERVHRGRSYRRARGRLSQVYEVTRRLNPGRLAELRRIGIDAFSYRKRNHYLTVVVGWLWAGKGRSAETLDAFFDLLGPTGCCAFR